MFQLPKNQLGMRMTEPSVRFLDEVQIDDARQYIEFRFRACGGEEQAIQIDFEYVESLAALFQQALMSATLDAQRSSQQTLGQELLAVPHVEVDRPVNVCIDLMTDRVVTMFLLGSPFQVSYTLPAATARALASDLVSACDEVRRNTETARRPAN
jgi:hypothetical protein